MVQSSRTLLSCAVALALVLAAFIYGAAPDEVHEPVKLLAGPTVDTTAREDALSSAPAALSNAALSPAAQQSAAVTLGAAVVQSPAADPASIVPMPPITQYGADGLPMKRSVSAAMASSDNGTAPTPGRNWTPEQTRAAFAERDRIANLQRANEPTNTVQAARPSPDGALEASKTQSAVR